MQKGFYILFLSAIIISCMSSRKSYPQAKRVDVSDTFFGKVVPDPYRWMEDLDDPDLKKWMRRQNEYTQIHLKDIEGKAEYRKNLEKFLNYERIGMPRIRAGREFYFKNDGLQDQYVLYLKEKGQERVLLDPNRMSSDGTLSIDFISPDESGGYMAYGISSAGSDWTDIHVLNVKTGETLDDKLSWVKFSGADWHPNGTGFYYSRLPEVTDENKFEAENKNSKLYFHTIGENQSEDQLIYEDPVHPDYSFWAHATEDHQYLILGIWNGTSKNNLMYVRPLESDEPFKPLINEWIADMRFLGNDGILFYFITDLDAPKNRLIAMDINHPAPDNWTDIISEKKDVLSSAVLIHNHFAVEYRRDVAEQLEIYAIDGQYLQSVGLPGRGTLNGMRGRQEDTTLYFSFSSHLYPGTVFSLDMNTFQTQTWFEPEMGIDLNKYAVDQVFYPSKDSTQVPMYIIYNRDMQRDGSNPAYLYGYGGFQISIMPSYSAFTLAWLEAGGVYAVANIRGGSEYGEEWHSAGMLHNKQTVFDDFIAAGEYLIEKGFTTQGGLAIGGRSNGGLLTSAVMVQRPDLFGAVECSVPVTDMLRYHKFTIGWAWMSEFGDPEKQEDFDALFAYSPLHNIKTGVDYPPMIITTGDYDDRVVPSHSFKLAAELQQAYPNGNPIVLRVDINAGHGAGKPISKWIEERVDVMAFLLHHLRKNQDQV